MTVADNLRAAKPIKPLGRKAYGSIGHLPSSRIGPGDHHVHAGQEVICCVKARDKQDRILAAHVERLAEALDKCRVALKSIPTLNNHTPWCRIIEATSKTSQALTDYRSNQI